MDGKIVAERLEYDKKITDNLLQGEAEFRIPQAYGIPKVYTDKISISFRVVVNKCGSLLIVDSTYIDIKLSQLIKKLMVTHVYLLATRRRYCYGNPMRVNLCYFVLRI